MTVATLTWFTITACVIYLMTQDENIAPWLVLLSKSVSIWFQQQWFKIRYNPDSPWIRWQIDRNARKLAKELTKEYHNK